MIKTHVGGDMEKLHDIRDKGNPLVIILIIK